MEHWPCVAGWGENVFLCVRTSVCVCEGGEGVLTHAVAQSEGLQGLHLIIYLHGERICQLYAQLKEGLHS